MPPVFIDFLVYIVLPFLRYLKFVWPIGLALIRLLANIGHFFTGGVFLGRRPIERKVVKTKLLKLYIGSNLFNPAYNEVQGFPDDGDELVVPRSRTVSSTSSSRTTPSTEDRLENNVTMNQDPFFNVAIESIVEGQHNLYHR